MRLRLVLFLMAAMGCQRAGGVCEGGSPGVGAVPETACTREAVGEMVCPSGQIGYGYRCTEAECWRVFADGPCAYPFIPDDAGMMDAGAGDAGTDAGSEAVVLCASSPSPARPSGACTASRLGAFICPAGAGNGSGYECTAAGCWQPFFDGPCSARVDGGMACGPERACPAEEGQVTCRGELRSKCYGGCWVDLDVCADGG